jgi:hypothetical protein
MSNTPSVGTSIIFNPGGVNRNGIQFGGNVLPGIIVRVWSVGPPALADLVVFTGQMPAVVTLNQVPEDDTQVAANSWTYPTGSF